MKEQLQAAKQNSDDTADDDTGSKEVDVMMSYVPLWQSKFTTCVWGRCFFNCS